MNGVSFDFTGTKVLVTGGTSGIGYAASTAFADAGASVTVTGTRSSAADFGAALPEDPMDKVEVFGDLASISFLISRY